MDLITCADCKKKKFNKSFGDCVNCKNNCHNWFCYNCVDKCLRNYDYENENIEILYCPKCEYENRTVNLIEKK